MRQELIDQLTRFLQGTISAAELQSQLIGALKKDLKKSLSANEAKMLNDFFAWYLDMYDAKRPPRAGILGRIQDRYAQLLHGEYRVSEADVRRKAEELRKLLLG